MIGHVLAVAIGILGTVASIFATDQVRRYRELLARDTLSLQAEIGRFDERGRAEGLNREALLARLQRSEPSDQAQAMVLTSASERLRDYLAQERAFVRAGPLRGVLFLFGDLDPGLAHEAWTARAPARMPIMDTMLAGGLGFLSLWAPALAVAWLVGRLRHRFTASA